MATERLRWFDMLKGIAILMVVMGHVLMLCVRGIDAAPLAKFIGNIHMPVFFFISGWLAYRVSPDGTGFRSPAMKPKALRLLVPMVLASTAWIYIMPATGLECPFDSTFEGLWTNGYKNGYWFTFVLFQIFVIYRLLCPLLRRTSTAGQIAILAAAWGAIVLVERVLPIGVVAVLSLDMAVEFSASFFIGVMAAKHADAFNRLTDRGWVCAVALVVIVASLRIICWSWEFMWLGHMGQILIRTLMQIAIAILGVGLVRPWALRAFASDAATAAPWARMWEFLGKRSLSIYLLHYWFLFPLDILRPVLVALNLSITPLMVVSAVVGAAIISVTLLADYVISYCGPLATWLTGSEPRNANV